MSRMVPAFNFNGILRPALTLGDDGNIIFTDELNQFVALYGLKALYLGLDASSAPKDTTPPITQPPVTQPPVTTPPTGPSDGMGPKGAGPGTPPPPVTPPPTPPPSGNGSTVPAVTFFGITRPELFLDGAGNILLTPAALEFIALYGLKALYFGVPPGTPFPPIPLTPLSTPVDANAAANSVAEGAAANTPVGLTASSTSPGGLTVTFSLTADSSNGGFKIDAATGVVSVADSGKIDFESTGAGHAYSVTVRASDGIFATTQTFTIGVSNVAPSTPTDANGSVNSIAEGAAAGTLVGITGASADVNGGTVTYSLTADSSNGGFTIDAATGVVRVADAGKIDYESSGAGHSYVITIRASDGALSSTQNFTIGVTDVAPSAPVDINTADNRVAEGAAVGTVVGVTAQSTDPNGPVTSYALTADSSGGGFQIDPVTGVVSVANSAKIDFESSGASHSYSVTAQATAGTQVTSQTFTISVADMAPSAPTDSDNAANAVIERAANGTVVGLTASSIELNGPGVSYSLTDNAGGRFAINSATGVVTVANGAAIDYETAPGHAYAITVQASAGALSSSQNFSIGVINVNEAPAGANKTITASEDAGYVFGVADFGFTDPADSSAPNALRAVQIASLPAAGTLTNNNVAVNPGDFISAADIAAGHLVFTPATNDNGAGYASFTFRVQDDGGTANGGIDIAASANTITVNVAAVNDAPMATGLTQSLTIAEDAAATTLFTVPPMISDIDSTNVTATLTLPIEAGVLVNAGAVTISDFDNVYTITGTLAQVNAQLATVGYEAAHDFNGNASVAVAVSDGQNGPQGTNPTGAVSITVTAVNDAPVNGVPAAQTVNEDTDLVFTGANAITIADVDANGSDVTVTLTVASGTLVLGSTLDLTSFTNNAASITLTGTVAHINTALDGLIYHGNLNFNGADTLGITTSDNGNTGSGGALADTDSVGITVTAVNDAPVNTVPAAQIVGEDGTLELSIFNFNPISISDIDVAGGSMTVTLSVAHGILTLVNGTAGLTFTTGDGVGDPTMTFSGTLADVNAAVGRLQYRPDANYNGPDTLSIATNDNGNTGTGGPQTDTDTVAITVQAANDAPVNSVPAAQIVNEDTDLVFSGGNAISISDIDVGAGTETVTLSVTNGVLTLGALAGLSFAAGDGTADGTMTFSGTIADINAALNGLVYHGNADFNGGDTLTITTNDNGNTGAPGPLTDTDTVAITVAAVNDAPTAQNLTQALTINEDAAAITLFTIAPVVADVDTANVTATLTLAVAAGVLNGAGAAAVNGTDNVYTITGTQAAVNAALAAVTYDSATNFNGTASVAVAVTDGANGPQGVNPTGTVSITVQPVNDGPINSVPGAQTVNEDTDLILSGGNAISISDIDVGAGTETVTLSVTNGVLTLGALAGLSFAAGDGTADGTMTFSGTIADINAALNGLVYHGNADFNGGDTLTITTNDNGNTGAPGPLTDTDTVAITVAAVNDAPTAQNLTQALTINEDAAATTLFTIAPVVVDVDTANVTATLTLAVAAGVLNGAGAAAVNGTDNVYTITGTQAAVNAALAAVTYDSAANFNGTASVAVAVTDGANGPQGVNPTGTVSITVNSVNDEPAGTDKSISSVGSHTFVVADFGFSDPNDTPANAFASVLISPPSTGTLTLSGNTLSVQTEVSVADITSGLLLFTPAGNATATIDFQVRDNGGVTPGVDTDQTPNTITLVQNTPPVANDDIVAATEAGGTANGTAGVDPTGNVITATGAAGAVGDTDAETAQNALTVVAVHTGAEGASVTTGTVGMGLVGQYGTLTLNSDGSYTYVVDQTNATVNALTQASVSLVDRFNYTIQDGGGLQDTASFTVSISGVNDAPVITSNLGGPTATVNVNENQTIVTTVTSTDPDLPAQNRTYSIVNGGDSAKFAIDGSGNLTFVAAPNFEAPGSVAASNAYTVQVQVTDNGNPNLNDIQTITVNVQNVNEAPTTNASTVTGNEDAASIAITLTSTDPDAGDSVTGYTITNLPSASQGILYSDAGLTTQVVSGQSYGATLYFVPAANYNTHAGAVTFSATAVDSHSLAGNTATETINVTAVNDAPINNGVPSSFTVQSGFNHVITGLSISDVDANEVGTPTDITTTFTAGAGTVVIGNGASGGTAGIAGGATVTTNGTGTVVLTGSVAQINTTLSGSNVAYNAVDSAANTSSTTTLQIATNDHGHNGTPGAITDTDTINIGVIPQVWFINSDQSSLDSTAARGSQTNPFATIAEFNASSGPGTNDYIYVKAGTYSGDGINLKAGQTLLGDDQALSFTNPLNPGGPAIVIEDATGTRPTINVTTAGDQGIALASGNTVAGVNVVTTASTQIGIDDSGASVGTLNISAADVTGSGQAINLTHGGTGGSVALGTVSSSGGATGIALGGALATNFSATSGTLSGHTSSEFSSNGGSGTVSYGGTIGDGTGLSASIVNRTGGTVTLSGNINDSNDTGGGIGISGNANTTINFTGATKTLNTGIGDGVSMTNNTGTSNVNFTNGGLDIDTTNGSGFLATVAGTYSVTGTGNSITANGNGAALNLSSIVVGAGGITFGSTSSTNSTGTAVAIVGVTGGAIALGIGSISGSDGDAFRVGDGAGTANTGGTSAISYAGSISKTDGTGQAVDIQDRAAGAGNITLSGNITHNLAANTGILLDDNAAGTITFSGASKSITSTTATAVNLTDNAGATIAFTNGGLAITSTTGVGFNATGAGPAATTGGTVTVEGSGNTITSSTGTALNVVNTTIGANNLTFQSIAKNGGTNGIVLNNTGTSGHLAVTGTGTTDGTGGTIQNTTGDAISLTNTQDVNLKNMNITGAGGNGINGTTVNGLVLSNLNISGSGNSTAGNGEGNIYLFELTGNASHITTFDNLNVTNSYVHNVFIQNTSGTLADLVVTNSTFSNNGASTVAGSQFVVNLASAGVAGSPTATVHATHNTFSGNLSAPATFTATGFQGSVDDGTLNVHLGDGTAGGLNTLDTNNSGITLSASNTGNLNFDVNNNLVTHNRAVGIAVNNFGTGTVTGFIRNTTVGTQGDVHSGSEIGDGLDLHDEGSGNTNLSVTNNIIQSVGSGGGGNGAYGIEVFKGVGAQNASGTFNLTLTGNTIRDILDYRGLGVLEGNTGNLSNITALISGNTFINANGQGTITTARIGGAPGGTDPLYLTQANAAAFAAANGLTTSDIRFDTNIVYNHAAPPAPPATPQLAAQGQGPGASDLLTMAMLTPIIAEAIQHWADAGATAAQIATLASTSFHIADLPDSGFLGNTDANGITIDLNAAGWGWFVDGTPADNSEFHATASPNELIATSGDAVGRIDLLTVVEHELGHIIGLPDASNAGVMNVALDTGERRLPDGSDVAKAHEAVLPVSAQAAASTPIVVGTAGNDSIDAGQVDQANPGKILFGGAGADTFVFGSGVQVGTQAQVTHVADYSAAQGDRFDFSNLTQMIHGSDVTDAMAVRAVEDSSGAFATLQVNTNATGVKAGPTWAAVAQLDGAHAGDAVDIIIGVGATAHLAHIHVDLLV